MIGASLDSSFLSRPLLLSVRSEENVTPVDHGRLESGVEKIVSIEQTLCPCHGGQAALVVMTLK